MHTKKIRCLQIITRLHSGGAEEAVLQLMRHLAPLDVHSDIAVGKEFNPALLEKFPLPPQCKIHHIPHLLRNPRPVQDWKAYRSLRKLIETYSYHIVNTHTAKAGILGRYAAHKAGVPGIVHTVHGLSFSPIFSPPSRYLYLALERWAGKFTSHFIFVSKELQKQYTDALVTATDRSSVIYVGIELEAYRRAASPSPLQRSQARERLGVTVNSDAVLLACIGRVTPVKNQAALLKLFPQLIQQEPNLHLMFLGRADPEYQNYLHKLCRTLRIAHQIHFLGYRPELWTLLPAFDIHCFAARHEGLPLVFVQTSAAGIPTVCFRCSGADEIIVSGKSGFVIEQGDNSSFVSSLLQLVRDSALRERMGIAAQRQSEGDTLYNWNLSHYAERTLAQYTQLLEQSL